MDLGYLLWISDSHRSSVTAAEWLVSVRTRWYPAVPLRTGLWAAGGTKGSTEGLRQSVPLQGLLHAPPLRNCSFPTPVGCRFFTPCEVSWAHFVLVHHFALTAISKHPFKVGSCSAHTYQRLVLCLWKTMRQQACCSQEIVPVTGEHSPHRCPPLCHRLHLPMFLYSHPYTLPTAWARHCNIWESIWPGIKHNLS